MKAGERNRISVVRQFPFLDLFRSSTIVNLMMYLPCTCNYHLKCSSASHQSTSVELLITYSD